jgi:hypothetical protein
VAGEAAVVEFAELMAAISIFDPILLADAVAQAEQLLANDVVVIPIGTRPVAIMRDRRIQGPTPTATSLGFLWNAEYWFRTDDGG